MMRWSVRAALAVGALGVVVVVWGMLLPEAHVATAGAVVSGSPDEVWAVITDVSGYPTWRPGVDRVERAADSGRLAWWEHGTGGVLGLEVVRAEPPRLWVTRILDEGQPFGGTWTYGLSAEGDGTRVSLREDGEVYNPIFRVVGRYLIGHDATMRAYLEALADRMGEP